MNKTCKWCGKPFETEMKHKIYCCKKCALEADREGVRKTSLHYYYNVRKKERSDEYKRDFENMIDNIMLIAKGKDARERLADYLRDKVKKTKLNVKEK